MLYLKRRKNESWGAMLIPSIYVYLLWGWRQWELSNILVKCLEDLGIKPKPAEVSCKSCCALLGAVSCTVCGLQWNIPLGKPGSAQCCRIPWARAGAWLAPSASYCSATVKSLLGRCQGRTAAVPPRPCLQHHRNEKLCPEWEQAEPGVSQLLRRNCSPREMCQGLLWHKLLELSFRSWLGPQGCQGSDSFAYGMSWH